MPEVSVSRIRQGARVATPLCRLADDLADLTGRRRYGLGFLLGVVTAAALPPVDLTPLIFITFPALLWLDEGCAGPAASFRLGWVFGFGYLLAGLYWIAAALFVDIAAYWWLVPVAAAGLPAVFALYYALALLFTRLAVDALRLPPTARIFAFAIAWTAAEWARGHFFTGLPWNLIGYVWSGAFPGASAMLQSVAWIGIYGLGLLTILAASLPALLGTASATPISAARRVAPVIAAGLLVGVPAAFGAGRLATHPTQPTGIWLRIVQPSIAESLKWNPAAAGMNFHRLVDLSSAPAPHPIAAVLWPEAASPFFLGRDMAARRAIAALAPPGGYVITGALRANPPPGRVEEVWNSLEAIDGKGEIVARYDKAHLVPFGEYMPLADILPFKKLTPGRIDLSAGPGPQTVALTGLPPFAPLICYEVIFPGAVVNEQDRPDWILNLTNDAWYGRSSGPFQHFAIARTRAIEEGLPLVRVANNGLSAVVDAVGRVRVLLGLDAVGHVDVSLPAPVKTTLYARAGDWVLLGLLLLAALPVASRLR
ncbi:MAG TPA: apolipoprotein N-acyltransferase [Stellaceae bacterium]